MVENKWIIFLVKENISDYFEIENSIKKAFKKADFFIPIHYQKMGSYDCFNTLIDGYVFVKDSKGVRDSLTNLPSSGALSGPLLCSNKIQTVNQSVITQFKKKLKSSFKNHGISEGNTVVVLKGIFESLRGEVISIESEEKAVVRFVRLSREFIAPIPLSSLRVA